MSADTRVDEVVRRWRELLQQGQYVPAEELCAECPELIEAVEHRIQAATQTEDDSQIQIDTAQVSEHSSQPTEAHRKEHESLQTLDVVASNEEFSSPAAIHTRDDSPTEDEIIFSVSQYYTFKFLAKGGLGEVYVAGDKDLHRQVALKFIKRDQERNLGSQNQFQLEGEIAAQLQHPGVVPVYGMGHTSDGRPFHVMRYIDGETLGDIIGQFHRDAKKIDPSEYRVKFENLISRFISVCNTLAYAHNRGILHRDIKPDNIMLGKYGETLVVDWGLAVPMNRDETARSSGEPTLVPGSGSSTEDFSSGGVFGTPSYMSPEQAAGASNLAASSDIYSLGALLYKMITGETPVQGSHVKEILRKVRKGEFPAPSAVKKGVHRSLEAVCLKAMARNPKDRYKTALELKEDVQRWRADEPVTACCETMSERFIRWVRRHQSWTRAGAAAVLAIVVATTAWSTSAWNHREILIDQRLDDLNAKADVEQEMLLRDFRILEQDVQFLATRPALRNLDERHELSQAARQSLASTFQDFLQLKPSYMQARFLDKDGMEIIRVDRERPGSKVTIKDEKQLAEKSDRPYFTDTIELAPGEVYLSKLELNQEHGIKQWDFPVVRAAVSAYGPQGASGIVIINMHFSRLTDLVKDSATEGLLVYLTNDEGEFLLHPVQSLDFCFERELEYKIEDIYPRLATFHMVKKNQQPELRLKNVKPSVALLIELKAEANATSDEAVVTLFDDHPELQLRPKFSKEHDKVILCGVESSELQGIRQRIENEFGDDVLVRELPTKYRETKQAVFCRKIFFDQRKSERFLGLVLVLPY